MSAIPAASARPERTGLDELMLAMDIVDTLRHEQGLVARELAADDNDAALVARIRGIYASQGIEVDDRLIAEGVLALKQDRFAYTPRPRSFGIRMAEWWVDRGKLLRRGLVAMVIGLLAWLVVVIPNRLVADREAAARAAAVAAAQEQARALQFEVEQIEAMIAPWMHPGGSQRVQAWLDARLPDLRALLGRAKELLRASIAETTPGAIAIEAAEQQRLDALSAELQAARAIAETGGALRDLARRYEAGLARITTMNLADDAAESLAADGARLEGLFAAGAVADAQVAIEQFLAALDQVDLDYRLRIVSQPGAPSGVWRRHASTPDGRNYYLVVEAVDVTGAPLTLSILNEETQVASRVSRFAVRVPKAVYERVRADQSDNGLIDAPVIADKPRGALSPRYRIAVSGGMITEW